MLETFSMASSSSFAMGGIIALSLVGRTGLPPVSKTPSQVF
jgi:hypothetical protein